MAPPSIPELKKWLSIVIIGGGIGGLTAAIGFRLSGHQITIVEQRARCFDQTDGGSVRQGLNQTANSKICLHALGLEEAFHKIADTSHEVKVKRYSDGALINTIHKKKSYSMVHREDLLRILYQRAVELGVEVVAGETFESIEETSQRVKVQLQSGRILEADLLVGADGIHSKVREHVPSIQKVAARPTSHCVFLVDVPKPTMFKHSSTAALYESGQDPFHFYVAPGRCIVFWSITTREIYHLQFCDFQYGKGDAYESPDVADTPFVTAFTNMSAFRERWADFEESITRVLDETTVCTKWRIADTPLDMSWWSESRRIALIGDAAHTFEPFAGQGAAMAIEDATVLSRLVARMSADPSLTLDDVATAYEALRRPRINGIRQIVKANIAIFGLEDGGKQEERDRGIGKGGFSMVNEEVESRREEALEPNVGHAKLSTEESYAFTEDYDAIKEANQYRFREKQ